MYNLVARLLWNDRLSDMIDDYDPFSLVKLVMTGVGRVLI
jgi:hypothetical protein